MKIFLIGYMGCGKSTLGKPLAQKLGYRFIDMDSEIEKKQGLSISEIFNQYGESAFREMERDFLEGLDSEDNLVVSTGGGTPCFFENMQTMNRQGMTIYLRVNEGVLASRLMEGRQKRPLLAGKSREELEMFIKENISQREPFYSQAQHIIEGIGIQVNDIINAINFKR